VDTFISYHFREERFRRHDPKKVVKEQCKKYGAPWEYTLSIWEEEEIHSKEKTYDEVINLRQGKPLGRSPMKKEHVKRHKIRKKNRLYQRHLLQPHMCIPDQTKRKKLW
jgi:hypothetical protein